MILADNFTEALSEALEALPEDWDVLLLGALGAVHPRYYTVNLGHAVLAGGCRYPRGAARAFCRSQGGGVAIHTPLRAFGTHAYALSERGAKKLLAFAPRANYHVDVIAWGLRGLRLFAVHPLLARQTHEDTTIGGSSDRTWLPDMVIDQCTPRANLLQHASISISHVSNVHVHVHMWSGARACVHTSHHTAPTDVGLPPVCPRALCAQTRAPTLHGHGTRR